MSNRTTVLLYVMGMMGLVVIVIFSAAFYIVERRTTAFMQRIVTSVQEAGPGIRAKNPSIDRVIGRLNLLIQHLDFDTETWTKDRVLVQIALYVDRLKGIGVLLRTNTIPIPHSPDNLSSFWENRHNAPFKTAQTVMETKALDRPLPGLRSAPPDSRPPGSGGWMAWLAKYRQFGR